MTFAFLGTGFPHLENKSTLAALDRLLVADSQTNMWNGKQITFAQFQAIVASNVESVNGLTGIVALGLTDLDDIPDPTTGSTFLSWNGSAFVWAGGGVGETNLAANVGSGADIWKDKDGVTFNFRGINGIQGIAAAVNSDNIDINFDVASLTAGQKTALVAATAAEMAAAIDLTDLGDVVITAPSDGQVLTWNGTNWVNEDLPSSSGGFNINGLSLVTTANASADFVAIYSTALAAHKKISITNLLTLAGFTGDIYFKVSSADTTPSYGATKITASNGVQRTIVNPSGAESMNFSLDYSGLIENASPDIADTVIAIFDENETYKKILLDDLYSLDNLHLLLSGGAMTGAILEAKGSNMASATTVNLATATGNLIHITGTTTITGFGTVQAGAEFTLVFDGALTIVHNATTLKLNNAGENIVTVAGDSFTFRSEGSGNWRLVGYALVSGEALVSPSTAAFSSRTKEYTAGEDLFAGDYVYISAANTVKRMKMDSYNSTLASVSTSPGHATSMQYFPLSTAGYYLHFTGGQLSSAQALYAQVRTLNSTETDVTNGSEATVSSTTVQSYNVCQIATDKFLVIYQLNNTGSPSGIRCKVVSVSGTTITLGSEQAIETTGSLSALASCAKVDTDKALIVYQKDSDQDVYMQVLTISTTTITTNTPVAVYTTSTNISTIACDLTTNSVLLIHDTGGSSTVFGHVVTVSGTTPSLGAQQSIGGSFGASSHRFGMYRVSATKALLFSSDDSASSSPSTDSVRVLSISGSTITAGTPYEINGSGTGRHVRYFPCVIIDESRALIATMRSSTEGRLNLLDISTTTVTNLQTSLHSVSSATYGSAIVKAAPWTYVVTFGDNATSDYILKGVPISNSRIGFAENNIANAVLDDICLRFQIAITSGLTAGSTYYVDDSGRLTANYSLTAPVAGIADSTTTLLLT